MIDCPESNTILDRVNHRVKETIYQLDMAKDNSPKVRERLERTWLLQKRLSFKDKVKISHKKKNSVSRLLIE